MTRPIEDYALIGDTQTAALVSRDGSIDWFCAPRFDSPAPFAALLGGPEHGRWIVEPANPVREVTRRYLDGTMILETFFTTDEGSFTVTDFMPLRDRQPTIVRIVEGRSGEVPVRTEVLLRFDYGSLVPWVRAVPGGIHAVAGADAVSLHSEIPLHGEDSRSVGEAIIRPGERLALTLAWHPSHEGPLSPADPRVALLETEAWWMAWSGRCQHQGPWEDAVHRSLLTLKALSYAPTGGIVAAPTTSLPEEIGGVRNWDYRFCWLRDGSYTLAALLDAGYQDEADAWALWFRRAIAGDPADLQIMYGVGGERRLSELELEWLPGYAESAPVRIGNAASDQFQLDVFGEVLDLIHTLVMRRPPAIGDLLELGEVIMEHLEGVWQEPDDGIWEVRGGRQQFVHSKVMAWVAADRWVRITELLDPGASVSRWERLRDAIHAQVMDEGWNEEVGAFTQRYGSTAVDAGALLIPIVGFLPADHPKVRSTIEVIVERLAEGPYLRRYDTDRTADGLPGAEGSFLLTSFWLVQALALCGRRDEAVERFEQLLTITNDVGLLAEEYDVSAGRQLGNYPQAFSHLGLVVAATTLAGDDPGPAQCRSKAAEHPLQADP